MKQGEKIDLGKRIRAVRTGVGLSQTAVARALGLSKQLISHWETGRSEITIGDVMRLASLLGTTEFALLHGEGGPTPANAALARRIVVVPMLTPAEVIAKAEGALLHCRSGSMIPAHSQVSADAIAFEIFDGAMAPTFARGDRVIVDPKSEPEPGDVVLVAYGGRLLFRRLRPGNALVPLEPPLELRAECADHPVVSVPAGSKLIFIGTLREHTRLVSRDLL